MAKEKRESYPYPSHFGSHKSMVDQNVTVEDGFVICNDEFGSYKTPANRLDTGLADPNRYAESRLTRLFVKKDKDK